MCPLVPEGLLGLSKTRTEIRNWPLRMVFQSNRVLVKFSVI